MRIALNQMPQLVDPIILFPQFEQSESLFQLCGRSFIPTGEILHNLIVALRRLLVVRCLELQFA